MRIEHFGMFQMDDGQLERAKEMKSKGLHVSVQPIWLLELVKADYENMGALRASTGFQFRSMIDAGFEPAASTDMTGIYLGNINPFEAMYAMVTRESDRGLFVPGQAISVTEALKMWTIWAAKSMGQADVKGTIEPGKYADMTVLSDDIFTMPKENLKECEGSQDHRGRQSRVRGEVSHTEGLNVRDSRGMAMRRFWFALGPLIALSFPAFLVGGCGMNPIERSIGAVEAMGANTAIMAANTGSLSQNTRSMAYNTAHMADSTQRMSQMTDRMAKATEGMGEATKRMAEATEKMEKNTGALSGGRSVTKCRGALGSQTAPLKASDTAIPGGI